MARDPRILRLESIEDQYKADAIRQIAEARKRIARIVTAAAKDGGFKITGRNRDKLYGLVDAEYAKLEIGLRNWSKSLVTDGVKGGMAEAQRELEAALSEAVKDDLTKFSRQYAEDVFKIISPGNESQLAGVLTGKMSATDLSNLRKAQRDVFRQAALEGWTAKRKERELKDRWQLLAGGMEEAKFTDAAGKVWDADAYVNMLTRTTSARVWRDGYAESLVRHGDDLARVENVDGEACDVCQAWDGLIVSISGGDKDFPSYQQAIDAGVFHVNCRCTISYIDPEMDADDIARQRAETTPSDLGDVAAVQAYNDATATEDYPADLVSFDKDYRDAVENDATDEAQEILDRAAEKAGFAFHRYTAEKSTNGMEGVPWAMFTSEKEKVENAYGPKHWVASSDDAIHADDLVDKIQTALENSDSEYLRENAAEIANLANPKDIVDSAGLWDDADAVQVVWDKVLEPEGILKVETDNGLLVFDPALIKSASPLDEAKNGKPLLPSRRFKKKGAD